MDPDPGEQVFFHGHPAWFSLLGFHTRGVLLAILAGAGVGLVTSAVSGHVQVGWVIVAVLAVFLAILLAGLLMRLRVTYTITDRRLTIVRGFLSRDLHETRLERLQNVNARQSVRERILGIGTVDFDTAGGSDFDFAFRGVADPNRIVRTVDRALQQMQRGAGI